MAGRFLTASAALALVAACSSTGGGDFTETPTPVVDGSTGQTGPQRNLLLSDMSYGSPGRGRAINETFELQVSTFQVAPDANGSTGPSGNAVLGLVANSADMEGFSEGNTLTFTAATGEFVFDINTDTGAFSRSVFDILIDDPSEIAGLENSRTAKLWGSNPTLSFYSNGTPYNFQDAYPLAGINGNSSVTAIANALTALAESDVDADQDYYDAITNAANQLIDNPDQFHYGYNFAGGYGYYTATNQTSSNGETETVAIGEFSEFADTGEQTYGFFVYGHRTPLGEMPATGTALYEGKVSGAVLTNNSVRSLTGSANMDVNFSTGLLDFSIATLIREGGNNEGGTTFLPYKDLNGTGTINDTIFSGNLIEPNGDSSGDFQGAFFGPVANEAGGTFRFGNGASYAAGAFTVAQPTDD
ncbi:transferrin-binding protein-like solute binding protein [Parvularcula marina]|uniref:transferrin-binding protein-like solute binding protein n=1 Tax=Parvularcula marina TaxID=2292771 RepID=UPI0035194DF3